MLKLSLAAVVAACLLLAPQDEAKKSDEHLKGVKCCMMPKSDVKAEQHVDYRDGKVYFCCAKCKTAFSKDTAKFAEKGNLQLVQTKQYEQKKCPISGQDVADDQSLKVGEIEIKFCCENCLGKVKGAKDDAEKAKLVFGDEAFEKAFAKVEAKADEGKDKKDEHKKSDGEPTKAKKAG
jgi:YHS domain-containing protein